MAGTVTLLPTAATLGGWSRTGGSSNHGALGDASDASYWWVDTATGAGGWVTCNGSLATIPAGARIWRVGTRLRGRGPTGTTPVVVEWGESTHAQNWGVPDALVEHWGGIATLTEYGAPSAAQTNPTGSAWNTDADARKLGIGATAWADGGATVNGFRAYEAAILVDYDERPTLADVGPTSTVLSSTVPLNYTYSDDLQPQYSRRDVIYAGTVGSGATAASLPGGTVVHDSGEVVTGAETASVGGFSNGTYTRYVRVTQQFGIQSVAPTSLWYRQEFTVAADVPDAPDVDVTVQPDGTVLLEIADPTVSPDPPADWHVVEFRDHDDNPWTAVRGAGQVPPESPAVLVLDREAPFDAVRTYRVRSVIDVSGTLAYSDATTVTAEPAPDGRWITDPYGTLHVKVKTADHATSFAGRDVVHYPAGMSVSVVESDATVRHDTMALWSLDDAEHADLVALLRSRRTLLFRDRRTYMYFRWHGDRASVQFGPDGAQVDTVAGQMVETARPA